MSTIRIPFKYWIIHSPLNTLPWKNYGWTYQIHKYQIHQKNSEHTNQRHATTESETPTGDCSNKHHYWSADLRDRMKMLRISRRCKKTIERYKNTMQTSLLTNGLEAPKAADSYEGVVNSNRPLIASTRWSKKCKRRWWRIWHNAKDYDRFLKMKLILQSMNLVLNIFEIYHSINENET